VDRRRLELQSAAAALNAMSPLATLERGYAIVRGDDGKTVRSAHVLTAGSAVDLVFRDGVAAAIIGGATPNAGDAPVAGAASGTEP
jgi:exodeoxyribonuclease VII large subunit